MYNLPIAIRPLAACAPSPLFENPGSDPDPSLLSNSRLKNHPSKPFGTNIYRLEQT